LLLSGVYTHGERNSKKGVVVSCLHRYLVVLTATTAIAVPIATSSSEAQAAPNTSTAAETWAHYNRLFNPPAAAPSATTASSWAHYNRLLNASAGPAPAPSTIVVAVTSNGFDWRDAGIGAAATLTIALLTTALLFLARASRRSRPAH
jgi:hypothetical protein